MHKPFRIPGMSEPATREPDARKRACPVREGADGKGPAMVPRQRPTSWDAGLPNLQNR